MCECVNVCVYACARSLPRALVSHMKKSVHPTTPAETTPYFVLAATLERAHMQHGDGGNNDAAKWWSTKLDRRPCINLGVSG